MDQGQRLRSLPVISDIRSQLSVETRALVTRELSGCQNDWSRPCLALPITLVTTGGSHPGG